MFLNLHQRRSQQTRQRLLEAAVELLAQTGNLDLSLHEVAREAGMTTGAVQHHFASVAGLRAEVLSRLVQSIGEVDDFWPDPKWPLKRRADHFVAGAWKQVFGRPRFGTAWGAFLTAQAHKPTRAYVMQRLTPIMARMSDQLLVSFPELGTRPDGIVRAQFVLAALRGMGLAAPFCPPGFFERHLQLLTDYLVKACDDLVTTGRRQRPPAAKRRGETKSSR